MNELIDRHPAPALARDRHLSPTALRSGQLGPMLLLQARSEFLKLWRIPMFSVPTLLFPILLFLLFGAPNAHESLPDGTPLGQYVMASFAAYGLLGIAFFSFGIGVASERGQGWMKLMRATPLPAWVYFAGKVVMALAFATLLLLLLFLVAALVAGVRMAPEAWALLGLTLVLGMLPLATAGFALGYWAPPTSAGAIANLIYLPIAYASGFLMPVPALPPFVQALAPYLPPYHYGQLAWRAVGVNDGQAALHIAWLIGTAVVFGGLAVWGYRRDTGKQFG
ncbi:MAG: ABC transporter permease [Chloroflexales bacterium]|nr:ABC transporter permease [Chloroflexales bacterium]